MSRGEGERGGSSGREAEEEGREGVTVQESTPALPASLARSFKKGVRGEGEGRRHAPSLCLSLSLSLSHTYTQDEV